jgi:hypothetical protein
LLERFAPTRLFVCKGAGVLLIRRRDTDARARRRVQAVDWNARFFMAWAMHRRIRPCVIDGSLRPTSQNVGAQAYNPYACPVWPPAPGGGYRRWIGMRAFSWHGRSIAESDHELLLERFAPTRLFVCKGAGVLSIRRRDSDARA